MSESYSRKDKHKTLTQKIKGRVEYIANFLLPRNFGTRVKTLYHKSYGVVDGYLKSLFFGRNDEVYTIEEKVRDRDPEREWKDKMDTLNLTDDWNAINQADTRIFGDKAKKAIARHDSDMEANFESDTIRIGELPKPEPEMAAHTNVPVQEAETDEYLMKWNLRDQLINGWNSLVGGIFESAHETTPEPNLALKQPKKTKKNKIDTSTSTSYNETPSVPVYSEAIPTYEPEVEKYEPYFINSPIDTVHKQSLEEMFDTHRMRQITEEEIQHTQKKIKPVDPSELKQGAYNQMRPDPFANIHDVAEYLLGKAADVMHFSDSRHSVTHLKLNYLLYYVQAWHVVAFNRPLFNVEFEAFTFGIRAETVSNAYERYGSRPLPRNFEPSRLSLHEDCMQLIDDIWNLYGWCSEFELEQKIRNEDPWKIAFLESPDGIVSLESMKSYYSQFVF